MRYRREIQGLRAVAVALVVAYHVWLGRVSGGVDVFFVISGFLITDQLSRRYADPRRVWMRAARRLLPAALTVLVAVVAASVVLLPVNRWFQTIREVVAAALFAENWLATADSADYFARYAEASPVQHYWSLSVQGQFYLVWPLLVVLATSRGGRRATGAALAAVFAASLAYSVVTTAADQPAAYFDSLARAWEFALGGLLALALRAVRLPRGLRIPLGWLGIGALVACGLVLRVGGVFPGYAAFWPGLAAAAVIAAGSTGSRLGADRWLGSAPLVYAGNLAYALYLWHWPVLVFYLVTRGRAEVGLKGGVAVVAVSVVLAVLTHHLVERPARAARTRLAVLALVPVLVAAGGWQLVSERRAAAYAALVPDRDHPGALALAPGFEYWGAEHAAVIPPPAAVRSDYAPIAAETCTDKQGLLVCTAPVAEPSMRVVVAGDSHMQQLLAALDPIATRRGWQLVVLLKGGCTFPAGTDPEPCLRWNDDVMSEILTLQPDVVFTNGSRDARSGPTEQTPPGFVAAWRTLALAGIPVLAVRDNPRYASSPALCAELHGPADPRCAPPRASLLSPEPPYANLDGLPPTVSFLDFSNHICTPTVCPPVVGNVHVYLDENHLTATYLRTMTPVVERAIDAALGR